MNVNCYLGIILTLIAYFLTILIFVKKPITEKLTNQPPMTDNLAEQPITENIYNLDSRIKYPYNPPVNPMFFKNQIKQLPNSEKIIQIPLQTIDGEQLRSQEILITPFNKIKYC